MADAKPSLGERLLAGDKRALARGISLVEDDDPEGWALVREVYPHTGSAAVVGFTGPPGAGKSTLIGALVAQRRGLAANVRSPDPFDEGVHRGGSYWQRWGPWHHGPAHGGPSAFSLRSS